MIISLPASHLTIKILPKYAIYILYASTYTDPESERVLFTSAPFYGKTFYAIEYGQRDRRNFPTGYTSTHTAAKVVSFSSLKIGKMCVYRRTCGYYYVIIIYILHIYIILPGNQVSEPDKCWTRVYYYYYYTIFCLFILF